ncbi:MAG: F0F1 ATP synthase subunit A [Bdellovibrionaceae bacterium]|nr:F0F1 ATP synthase subunit A [Pseudobdellovibrionaceae bacterium]
MTAHFTWSHFISTVHPELYHAVYAGLCGAFLLMLIFLGKKALNKKKAYVPEGKFSLKAFFEIFVELMAQLSDSIVGKKGRSILPLFCFFFLFIWIQNLLGLFPGFLPPSQNLNSTLALGVLSFLAYNYYGIKEHGLAYMKQFVGPVLFLAPLFIFIEVLSHIFRSVSLGFRLFGNMSGDHIVIGIFLDMVPFLIPVIFYFLGLFVCTLQAFVFTILSMVYVSLAISHDH